MVSAITKVQRCSIQTALQRAPRGDNAADRDRVPGPSRSLIVPVRTPRQKIDIINLQRRFVREINVGDIAIIGREQVAIVANTEGIAAVLAIVELEGSIAVDIGVVADVVGLVDDASVEGIPVQTEVGRYSGVAGVSWGRVSCGQV